MPELFLQAMEARQRGDIAQAKQLLAQALIQDPHNEDAWMLMSEVVDQVNLKRNCLQRVLLINPQNSAANEALMRLETSPLGPVVRGERYKSVIPPKIEKAPPFTPPFTWTGDEAQFQALGEMTYPDLTGEDANQMPETPTTFDWAKESAEPDKTIDKIFDAVSNPELAAEPLPDTDLSWLDDPHSAEATALSASAATASEAEMQDDRLSQTSEATLGQQPTNLSGYPASPEDQFATDESGAGEESQETSTEPDPLLWDNPKAKLDRMVILGSNSIIYANPAASDVPHIMDLFNEKKMQRELLGENAGTIKLEDIQRLTANPKRTNLTIDYRPNEKTVTHQLSFSNPQGRDEALDVLQLRMGADFIRTTRKFSLADKILAPLLIIVLVAITGWVLINGLTYLETVPAFQSGVLQLILVNLQYYVDLISPFNILMIAIILVALCLVWLVFNLSKPSSLIIVERRWEDCLGRNRGKIN
jgi:hypothetical protein